MFTSRACALAVVFVSSVSLVGCPELFEALAAAAAMPKIAYQPKTADPLSPVLRLAAIQETDRALVVASLSDFGAPGPLVDIALSPEEDYVAVTHIEEAGVTEARIMVFSNTLNQEAFETDNTVSTGVEEMCPDVSTTIAIGYGSLQELFPPDHPTYPNGAGLAPEIRFSDVPENEIGLVDWIDADSILLWVRIELRMLYVATSGAEIDFDIINDETLYLTYSRNADASWSVMACDDAIPADIGFEPSRDVSLGPSVGGVKKLLLDGVPVKNLSGGELAPGGVLRFDGPYL
jgi:hypothetical protein